MSAAAASAAAALLDAPHIAAATTALKRKRPLEPPPVKDEIDELFAEPATFATEVIEISSDEETAAGDEETSEQQSSVKKRKIESSSTAAAAAASSIVPRMKQQAKSLAAAAKKESSSFLTSIPLPRAPSYSSSTISFLKSPYWSYYPRACASSSACSRLYESLRSMVDPVPGQIFVYGKYHTENRLTKVFARRAGSFKYSGTEKHASGEWPAEIEELYQIAAAKEHLDREKLPAEYRSPSSNAASSDSASAASASSSDSAENVLWDTVLINYYRSGDDSISWHSDKDSVFFPIASFSFGAEREFQIRERPKRGEKSTKGLKLYSGVLANGSLLMMWPGMQERYHHCVPKRKGIAGGRVNVTLRLHHRMDTEAPVRGKA
jgi:hypothetical protein